jgi:hypothetical protein
MKKVEDYTFDDWAEELGFLYNEDFDNEDFIESEDLFEMIENP